MSLDENKAETIGGEAFSTFEEVEERMPLVGGSLEYIVEYSPDGLDVGLDW